MSNKIKRWQKIWRQNLFAQNQLQVNFVCVCVFLEKKSLNFIKIWKIVLKISKNEANLIMVRVGCAFGWLSLSLPLLLSDATPLQTGKLTTDEVSWIGCVVAPGLVLGNFLCGYIVTFIGTRHTLFLIGFPQMVMATDFFRSLNWSITSSSFFFSSIE